MKQWIMSVLSCGVLFCVAEALLPQGPVRAVGRMSIGMVLFLVVLRPLTGPVPQKIAAFLKVDVNVMEEERRQMQQVNESYLETIMREKSEEYIETQAQEMGVSAEAEVACAWQDGLPIPASAYIAGTAPPGAVGPLLDRVEQELGIQCTQICYEEVTDP